MVHIGEILFLHVRLFDPKPRDFGAWKNLSGCLILPMLPFREVTRIHWEFLVIVEEHAYLYWPYENCLNCVT